MIPYPIWRLRLRWFRDLIIEFRPGCVDIRRGVFKRRLGRYENLFVCPVAGYPLRIAWRGRETP